MDTLGWLLIGYFVLCTLVGDAADKKKLCAD